MQIFSRFPIIVWFLVISVLTSTSVSFYTYTKVFHNQTEEIKKTELNRINQRLIQLQGTVNDLNRRHNYNAIHREVSRLSSDSTMELIVIIDENETIKYSSLIEYRNTPAKNISTIHKRTHKENKKYTLGNIEIIKDTPTIIGMYPLEHLEQKENKFHPYIFARFNLSYKLKELYYRQQQEIIHITLIHFTLLLGGFLLLYLSMQNRIKLIIKGIKHFSDGNYDSRIKLTGTDEFSKISYGFDAMATKLQTQNQGLTDLTTQLSKQHDELALQERDLRVTLNSIGDAVITTDSTGLITRMNPVAQKLTGWSLDEAKGNKITTVFKIINSENKLTIENPIDKVIKIGQTVYLSNNTTLISRDGTHHNISDSAAPIRNEKNEIIGMVLIFNDVTEAYQLRQIARKSEQLLKSIMDNSPAAIYVKDINGEFTYSNQQFLTIFNLNKENILGKTLYDLFPHDVADEMNKNNMTVLTSGQTLEIEETVSHEDGLHIYSSIKFPLMDDSGEVYAVCGISTDITERKLQEQHLLRNQKMDALGKLTGGIAHDFNNILGIIMGYSEMLIAACPEETDTQKFANEILHASERGASLTRKLLSFSRPHQSEDELLNINLLLIDRQDMLEKIITARIKLKLELDEDLWPVFINGGDFEDAIVNITLNAMHAMKNGGVITVTTKNTHLTTLKARYLEIEPGDYVKISITDNGVGISKEIQNKVFDPFFTSKGKLGAGLGLTQVYTLVKSHAGAVKVDSELDQGACITIYLPKLIDSETASSDADSEPTGTLAGKETILVVDDEPSLRELTRDILTQHGYQVILAKSGQQALEILKTQSVDILLSDIIMPEMDGYKLANKVQQNYPDIKIQLVSGYDNNLESEENHNPLYENILHKPFTAIEVLKRIKILTQ